jgi:hypothetical protein
VDFSTEDGNSALAATSQSTERLNLKEHHQNSFIFLCRVVMGVFEPESDGMMGGGGWRNLLKEELHNFTFYQIIFDADIREDWGHVVRMEG